MSKRPPLEEIKLALEEHGERRYTRARVYTEKSNGKFVPHASKANLIVWGPCFSNTQAHTALEQPIIFIQLKELNVVFLQITFYDGEE